MGQQPANPQECSVHFIISFGPFHQNDQNLWKAHKLVNLTLFRTASNAKKAKINSYVMVVADSANLAVGNIIKCAAPSLGMAQ
jgi:hypothetical protein